MKLPNGVYAVCVGPDISDDPVRWLFANEVDADDFADAINAEREYKAAWVTFEPIAESIHDPDLKDAFPEEVAEVVAKRAIEAA